MSKQRSSFVLIFALAKDRKTYNIVQLSCLWRFLLFALCFFSFCFSLFETFWNGILLLIVGFFFSTWQVRRVHVCMYLLNKKRGFCLDFGVVRDMGFVVLYFPIKIKYNPITRKNLQALWGPNKWGFAWCKQQESPKEKKKTRKFSFPCGVRFHD